MLLTCGLRRSPRVERDVKGELKHRQAHRLDNIVSFSWLGFDKISYRECYAHEVFEGEMFVDCIAEAQSLLF